MIHAPVSKSMSLRFKDGVLWRLLTMLTEISIRVLLLGRIESNGAERATEK